jgi:hypothetical protein
MHYAFVMYPHDSPHMSLMFLHETIREIAGFEVEVLEDIIRQNYGAEFDVCDMNFFEIGEFKPITFERHTHYTINRQ